MSALRHRPIWKQTPIAWLQLTHQKIRFLVVLLGVSFSTLLIFAQLGIKESLSNSVSLLETRLNGDLFLVDQRSQALVEAQPFSRRLLILARDFPQVEQVSELLVATGRLKHPTTGTKRSAFVIGIDPNASVLDLPELEAYRESLQMADVMLFDDASSDQFGPVAEMLQANPRLRLQLEKQRFQVAGLFHLGASFAADGNVLMGKQAFERAFPDRSSGAIDIGAIRLRPGSSIPAVQAALRSFLPGSLRIMTKAELIDWEQNYWGNNTSIGVIFNQGVILGFIVGVVIVYQVLFTDIANHLKEYATLKAIGYGDRYLVGIVFQEALILSILGYLPGLLASIFLYRFTQQVSAIPMEQTWERSILVFLLTLVMCFFSGLLAIRKLHQASPAEVF